MLGRRGVDVGSKEKKNKPLHLVVVCPAAAPIPHPASPSTSPSPPPHLLRTVTTRRRSLFSRVSITDHYLVCIYPTVLPAGQPVSKPSLQAQAAACGGQASRQCTLDSVADAPRPLVLCSSRYSSDIILAFRRPGRVRCCSPPPLASYIRWCTSSATLPAALNLQSTTTHLPHLALLPTSDRRSPVTLFLPQHDSSPHPSWSSLPSSTSNSHAIRCSVAVR